MEANGEGRRRPAWSHWYWLLAPIYIATLWVPFYNRVGPEIFGFPFFYAYQIGWVLVSAVLTAIVFVVTS